MTISRRFPRTWIQPGAWLIALAVAWTTLVLVRYESRDPDSALHVDIERDLASLPAARWIAPEWWGYWDSEGLYREHPVGIFLPPVLLARLGYPAAQAGYAINALYQVLTILLIYQLAAVFLSPRDARALAWLLQLLPIAFTYRVRANHEQAVLLCLLVAIYATERARRSPAWGWLQAAATAAMLLVKGMFAVLVPLVCGLWLILGHVWSGHRGTGAQRTPRSTGHGGTEARSDVSAWLGLAGSVVVAVVLGLAYESAYRHATGQSFLAEYLRRQLVLAAAQTGPWPVLQKLENVAWYLGRIFWFALPWTIVLLVAAWHRWRGTSAELAACDRTGREWQGLALTLAVAVFWVALFSLSDRRADRYIFPVYVLVGGAGAGLALCRSPRLRGWVARVEQLHPVEIAAVWLALFFLHIASVALGLPLVKL
jgi:hypothetical protein